MDIPVEFSADHTPAMDLGWGREWAVASRNPEGDWVRGEVVEQAAARQEAELVPGSRVVSREVSGWSDSPVYVPRAEYDGSMDALVEQIIDKENAVVRDGLLRGAEIAVTHMGSPSQRMAHRISCLSLRDQFDRTVAWPTRFREKLQDDRSFRPGLATLITRQEARELIKLGSCKMCWPNIGGEDMPPTNALLAQGLKNHHIGRVLADQHGLDIGTIQEVIFTRRAKPTGGSTPASLSSADVVTVVTDKTTVQLDPRKTMQVRTVMESAAARAREAAVRERVGLPATKDPAS